MSTFSALTVGAQFDRAKHGAHMKLFKTQSHNSTGTSSGGMTGIQVEPSGSATHGVSSLSLPAPAADLHLFGCSPLFTSGSAEPNNREAAASSSTAEAPALSRVHTPLKPMTFKKMRNIWRKNELQVDGTELPAPINHFSNLVRPPLSAPESVVTNLFERNHRVPTPIQMQAIPSLIMRRDVLACAPTGSGKTLAFLVPLFALLQKPEPTAGVRALIMAPTMELAVQIEREAFFLMRGQRWKLVQYGQSTKNKDIFVTTPGRVMTLLEKNLIDLGAVEYLVFDEGDRLWDSTTDFIQVVDKVLAACTNTRKVVSLFSATLSEKVEATARSVMGPDPVRIIVRGRALANENVEQKLVFCGSEMGKIVAMRNLVSEGVTPPVLVFVQSIERSQELFDEIRSKGLHMGMINAHMTSEEREAVVLNFRLGKIWVLITTELLARGVDFKNVHTVINFDLPTTVESYIHRVGRTGRAGKRGLAITFFTEDDRERLPQIAAVVKESGGAVEDWMLAIKVDRQTKRTLQRTTPKRKIINTQKRIRVALKRTRQRYDAIEKAAEKSTVAKEKQTTKANKTEVTETAVHPRSESVSAPKKKRARHHEPKEA